MVLAAYIINNRVQIWDIYISLYCYWPLLLAVEQRGGSSSTRLSSGRLNSPHPLLIESSFWVFHLLGSWFALEVSSPTLHDSAPMELTAKILMTAAIVLFLVVIFVLILHLYAKWFWGRAEDFPAAAGQNPARRRRHHRRRRHLVFSAAAHGSVSKGLDPAILRSLPAVFYDPEDLGEGLECAICLSELVEGEKARLLPKCSHGFHSDCIDMWFESHSTCPICRNPVGDDDSSKSAETDVEDMDSSSSSSSSSNDGGELAEENMSNEQHSESLNFPTNVLFWGNENQVSSRSAAASSEEAPCSAIVAVSTSTSTSNSSNALVDRMLAIDIPRLTDGSSSRFVEEEPKSPVTTRLRSLKRLLIRDRRVNPCSSSSTDADQV
ncbi:hypothetical protein SAY87_029111 [Trapa incisa]|uniref:RING-type E3 ubiquitin transferase n=1 Tax=Trapa incisa TaxID=236973 RepID=A0AAN7QPX0_9MYRT|nr:hypothetical protein SAY87_029111 [Trapa incisa]